MEEHIKVIVRSRPLSSLELKSGECACVARANEGKEVQIRVSEREAQAFRCDAMLMSEATQEDFFHKSGVTALLDSALGGYRACVFAFGQTGAGKTHTMVGRASEVVSGSEDCGIMGRSLDYIYKRLSGLGIHYTVKIACMEIYQEQLFDLSVGVKERTPLAVREHQTDGFFVEGCKQVVCSDVSDAVSAVNKALKNRQVGSHVKNHRSNRSHLLTEIFIELPVKELLQINNIYEIPGFENLSDHMDKNREYNLMGRLTFVDLAGSERLKETKSEGKTLQETGNINKSLYVLGKVISGMARENGAQSHRNVPYRDSKLTKLLIHSLGGNSRTMMISCISAATSAIPETLRTLHFSMSAARIKNRPMRFMDPVEKLILELREEIKRLKLENRVLKSNLGSVPNSAAVSMKSFTGIHVEDDSNQNLRSSSQSKRGADIEKMIAEAGAGGDDECDDIMYSSPDKDDIKPVRTRQQQRPQPVATRRNKPVVVRRRANNKPGIVEELGKYDIHGRPKPAKRGNTNQTYDSAGHVVKKTDSNARRVNRQAKLTEPVTRRNKSGYERQLPDTKNDIARKKRSPMNGAGGGGGFASPHRSVSVPVIRIKKASDDRVPAATGIKKNTKSPFLAHLEKKKKKSPLTRNASDPNHLPPVNLSRDDESFSSNNTNNPRSNSRYANAASRYQKANKRNLPPPASPTKPTKVQLPHINNGRSGRTKPIVKTKEKTVVLESDDDDDDDGQVYHRDTLKKVAPPSLNRYDDDYESEPVKPKSSSMISEPMGNADTAAMKLSLNLESVKDKLACMEQQLVIRRQQVESSKATAADRSRLEALEEEVRDMQLEVQISSQLQGIQVAMMNKKSVAEKFPPTSPPNTRNLADLDSADLVMATHHSTPSARSRSKTLVPDKPIASNQVEDERMGKCEEKSNKKLEEQEEEEDEEYGEDEYDDYDDEFEEPAPDETPVPVPEPVSMTVTKPKEDVTLMASSTQDDSDKDKPSDDDDEVEVEQETSLPPSSKVENIEIFSSPTKIGGREVAPKQEKYPELVPAHVHTHTHAEKEAVVQEQEQEPVVDDFSLTNLGFSSELKVPVSTCSEYTSVDNNNMKAEEHPESSFNDEDDHDNDNDTCKQPSERVSERVEEGGDDDYGDEDFDDYGDDDDFEPDWN